MFLPLHSAVWTFLPPNRRAIVRLLRSNYIKLMFDFKVDINWFFSLRLVTVIVRAYEKVRNLFTNQLFITAAGLFILVLLATVFLVYKFGGAYRQSLRNVGGPQSTQEVTLKKKKQIRKITVQKSNDTSCIEVTPDGVVRVFAVCGGDLTQASRPTNLQNIFKLFKLVSEQDLAKYKQSGNHVYQITVETDTGSETYYLASDGGGGSAIIDTITKIGGDIPPSGSPSPTPPSVSPNPGSSPTASASPLAGSSPEASVSPGTGGGGGNPFACDFSEGGGGGKPYRVSNIVCTSEPSPVP